MRNELSRALAAASLLWLAACGGSNSTEPTVATTPRSNPRPNELVAGTTLRISAGETGDGVDGAVVTVAGRSYTSAAGIVTLVETAPLRSEVTIVAPDMLERKTLLRDVATTLFTLWPRTSVTGVDEDFTRTLVYTRGDASLGALRRWRRGTTRVVVVPSEELRANDAAMAAHQDAVDRTTAATGGQVVYVLGDAVPATGGYVETRIGGEGDELCRTTNVLAFAQTFTNGGEIVRGVVAYCDPKAARNSVVAHELGHTFGLQHSPEKGDLMYRFFNGHGAVEFGPRESLEMRLMLQRPSGNVFPDDDRAVSAAAGAGAQLTVCPGAAP